MHSRGTHEIFFTQREVYRLEPGGLNSPRRGYASECEGPERWFLILVRLEDSHRVQPLRCGRPIGDGKVVIEVVDAGRDELTGRILFGGVAKGRPGVHIPADKLDVSAPTPEDLDSLDPLVDAGIDMVAVSFVRTARDIRALGVEKSPTGPLVIAKIETRAAVDNLDTILDIADGVMVVAMLYPSI